MKALIIIHFRAIAYYPPIINLIRFLSEQRGMKIILFTSSSVKAPQFNCNVELISGFSSSNAVLRLFKNLQFHTNVFSKLVIAPSTPVMYFESLSCHSVWFYLSIFRKSTRKFLVHYHEFFSSEDYSRQSFWERTGRSLERTIFSRLYWISHTNIDRLSFFHSEFPQIKSDRLHLLPNYPPAHWIRHSAEARTDVIKFVYIGSLSFETIYLREFVEWLNLLGERFSCDFYSFNASAEVIEYLNCHTPRISFRGYFSYEDLPKILCQYNIGLVLYKAKSNNVTFSVPNKLFEYLACGLDVWCSSDLVSSRLFERTRSHPKVILTDFRRLNEFDFVKAIDRTGLPFKESEYSMESVYETLYQQLKSVD